MSLSRAAGRTMLASFFIANGAKAATRPDALVPDAEPVARKIVPLVQRVAPAQIADRVPEDTRQLVKMTGVAQVLGGLGVATGKFRRTSAALLGASMVPHVMASRPAKDATSEERTAARSLMLRNVALLGATVLVAQDTQGRPSLGWRASHTAKALSKDAQKQRESLGRKASKQQKKLAKKQDQLTRRAAKQARQITQQVEDVLS